MQGEGDVVRLPVAQEGPLDFATFFADEHRGLFRLLCFVRGNRGGAAGLMQAGPLDFATFFADEPRGLFRLLCFVTGNRADAADLMQDAFLKLWERWDRVERIADPRAYLFRVALTGSPQ